MIKIIIADDQVLLRDSLKFILEQDNTIEVLACCDNGKEAIDQCKIHMPDVLLTDIRMPVMDGIEATEYIKAKHLPIKVIMLTTFEDINTIMDAFAVGADGYIVKDIKPDEIISAVKCINKGFHIIHKSVHQLMVSEFKKVRSKKNDCNYAINDIELTPYELKIISLIAQGKTNKEVGSALGFAEGTIKNKISKIFEKLNLKDRTQIAIFAHENNLI